MPPSEVLAMPVSDYELLVAHFLLEQQEAERAAALQRAESKLASRKR